MPLFFAIFGAFSFSFCQWLVYSYAPPEINMGLIQKIFYTHLPLAWWALISFFMVFVCSIMYILRRTGSWDRFAAAAAETGVLFSGLALVTGILWGKVSWGVWWTWDPRLSTTLVMFFIYSSYLILRHMGIDAPRKRMICAVLGIVAFLDVPLVFFSARIWRTIHPAVFVSNQGGMEPEMLATAVACVLSFGFFWAGLTGIRKVQLDIAESLEKKFFF